MALHAIGLTGDQRLVHDLNTATAKTLFDFDTMADRVFLQSPANAGTLAPRKPGRGRRA
ncbi:hypothetical protein GTW69_11150 [Streptomyces sp. SID7760]|nr:hypothetical protein [Streptomyces sp. SID7760]